MIHPSRSACSPRKVSVEYPPMAQKRPISDTGSAAAPPEAAPIRTITVSQLNQMIKNVLSASLPGTIHLVGQISNLTRPASGHMYLTLKDEHSEIRAAMWRADAGRLKFTPADGMEVVATGCVDVYEPRGQYQFYIRKLEPRGVGALELAFRQLHDQLKREGLFDATRKRPIPVCPRRIAVVTSPTGAVVRDILTTIQRRFPCVTVMLHPVRVQGDGAAAEIAEAIRRLNQQAARLGGIDVMIVGRGGGSLEDLWAFNEEPVARAIHASRIPIISAVGHEVDITISDLVADLRAATPTAAAELAVPVLSEVLADLAACSARIARRTVHAIELARSRLAVVERSVVLRDPMSLVRRREQMVDELRSRLRLGASHRSEEVRRRVHQAEIRLAARSPVALLRQCVDRVAHHRNRLAKAAQHLLRTQAHQLDLAVHAISPALIHRRVHREIERLNHWRRVAVLGMNHRLAMAGQRLRGISSRIEATSYQRTLERGFTITLTKRGNRLVTGANQVATGEKIITRTADGEFESRVLDQRQGELFE